MRLEELDAELMKAKQENVKVIVKNIAEKYGISRTTVYAHMDNLCCEEVKERKRRSCNIGEYHDQIEAELRQHPLSTVKAVYMKMLRYVSIKKLGSYSNFVQYVRKHFGELRKILKKEEVKHRFETPPGEQVQVDWIEDVKMALSNGEIYKFNIWNATFGYSRLHVFIVSPTKTEEDFKRCLVETIIKTGGKPKTILTDNMSAIVSFDGKHRKVHPSINQFMHDIGIKLEFCKVKHPWTKGKNECSNNYQERLEPYQGVWETKEKAICGVESVLNMCNFNTNSTTQIPPYILFQTKEKSTLDKDINIELLRKNIHSIKETTVTNTSLIRVERSQYSVPNDYKCRKVLYRVKDGLIYIYSLEMHLIALHEQKPYGIHYLKEHITENLNNEISGENLKILAENLYLLANVGNYHISLEEVTNDLSKGSYR